ncbi:MAG: PHP domain-containing protein [Bacteroidetes Order II. Incertae sedis bacterium]|jgi:predicted metal-dependent phosphoesterase TrpH|nr:PHP domain-containing protein [Bacteroidetes Order II. bacterium]MBT6424822.1 PHP domain-containing protein [Bacteroidetes Order II. bacterium]
MLKADLHMHSTASDGQLSPTEVVRLASRSGLDVIALTDHDTTGGLVEARKEADSLGIQMIEGAEISASCLSEEVHLLSYGFDAAHVQLVTFLQLQQDRRRERAVKFVEILKAEGALPHNATAPEPKPGKTIARPHIAQMLIEAGTVSDMNQAFNKYLTPGKRTFIPKPLPDAQDVFEVVHSAGGKVVLAHPGHNTSHRVVMHLINGGLDGIEVVHPSHDKMLESYYRSLADQFGLFTTGGSDFHGRKRHGELVLGHIWIEPVKEVLSLIRTP